MRLPLYIAGVIALSAAPSSAGFSNGMNASLVLGEPDFTTNTGGTTQSLMQGPIAASFDPGGNLWVVDSFNDRILEIKPTFSNEENASFVLGETDFNSFATTDDASHVSGPAAIAIDAGSNVWVADQANSRVVMFAPPFTSNGEAATFVLGEPDFTSTPVAASQTTMLQPTGVAVDPGGDVWVADNTSNRVLEFTPPFSNGMNAALVLGQPDFVTIASANPPTQSSLWGPDGVYVDASSNVWVTDAVNSRILEFSPPFTNDMNASLVLGEPSFTTNAGGSTQALLMFPSSVYVDASSNVWISDQGNNRILEFAFPQTNGMNATLVLGQPDFTSVGSTTTQSGLMSPASMVLDSSGNAWAVDQANSRVLRFGGSGSAPAACSSAYTETGYSVTGCGTNTTSGANCSASCAPGYSGTVAGAVSCSNGSYTGSFSGCSVLIPGTGSPAFNGVGTSSVTFHWTTGGNTGAPLYEADISTDPAFSVFSSSLTFNLSVSSSGLDANTTYYAQVKVSNNGSGQSSGYGAVSSTSTLAALPGAASFTAVYLTSATLAWTNSNNNPPGTLYQVFYIGTDNSSGTLAASSAYSAALTGLRPDTTYYALVSAVNWNGISANGGGGALFADTTVTLQVPAPVAPAVAAVYQSSIAVSWGAPEIPIGYELDASTAANFSGTLLSSATTDGTMTSLAVAGLAFNTTYYLRAGTLFDSATGYALTSPVSTATLAAAPSGTAVTTVTGNSLALSWTQTNPAGTSYQVSYWALGGSTSTLKVNTNAATLTGLSASTTYYAQVRGMNWDGVLTAPDVIVTTVTLTFPTPTAPTIFAVNQTSITVHWGSVASSGGYEVDASTASDFSGTLSSTVTASGSAASLTVFSPALTVNTTYYLRAGAVWGNSTYYALTTPASTATLAAAPTGVAFTAVYATSATLTWTQTNPAGTLYRVFYSSSALATTPPDSPSLSATLTGLVPAAGYLAYVEAVNWNGITTAVSLANFASTTTLPVAPTGSAITAVSTPAITLSWTDGVNPAGISYEVDASSYSDFSAQTSSVTVALAASVSVAGFPPNALCYARVRALNQHGGGSAYDTTQSTVTLAAAPAPFVSSVTSGQNPSVILGSLYGLSGVALDGSGNVWVADTPNNRVLKFSAPVANGAAPSVVLSSLNRPNGVAVDSSGDVWVADNGNNRVVKFSAPVTSTSVPSVVLGSLLSSGLAVDSSGDLWMVESDFDSSSVLEFSAPVINSSAGNLVIGQTGASRGIAVDSSGNVWVTSELGGVAKYSAPVTSNAAPSVTLGSLSSPEGVAVDSSGNVWVADYGSSRVLKFSAPVTNASDPSVVLNSASYPSGVAVDNSGNVWVADNGNNRVVEFQPTNGGVFFSSMTVSWSAGSDPAGTQYSVQASTAANFSGTLIYPGGAQSWTTQTNATFTGLTPGVQYFIEVQARNSTGIPTPFTSLGGISTLLPPSPTGLAATALGVSSIAWSWNAVAGALSYDFYPSTGGAPISASPPGLTQVTLSTNTAYGASIGAVYAYGSSPLSAAASGYTLAAPATGFSVTSVGFSSVAFSWGTNTDPNGTSYTLSYYPVGGSTSTVTTNSTPYTLTGLLGATTYTFTLSAVNGGGLSTAGVALSTVTRPGFALAAVTDMSAGAAAPDSLLLQWTAKNTVGAGAEYLIQFSSIAVSFSTAAAQVTLPSSAVTGAAQSTTLTGLTPNTAYSSTLWTQYGVFSPVSNTASAVTLADAVGPPFTNGANASLVLGQANFFAAFSAASQSGMNAPQGVTADGAGNLWVADYQNNRVLEFKPPFTNGKSASLVLGQANFTSAVVTLTPSQSGMNAPWAITADSAGNLWVADAYNSRVLEFKPPFSNGMNASLVLGEPNFTSRNVYAVSQSVMAGPLGVTADGAGNLWVADSGGYRVLEFKPPFTNGMNASVELGQADFSSAVAATSQSGMADPIGVTADAAGNLWVVDEPNNRVLEFKPPFTSRMNASLVLGQANFNSAGSATSQSLMNSPYGVTADGAGNIWVADEGNSRVLEFQPPFTNGMNASLVLGEADFDSSNRIALTTQSLMNSPSGVTADGAGNLWVADYQNNRVLEFKPSAHIGGVFLSSASVSWLPGANPAGTQYSAVASAAADFSASPINTAWSASTSTVITGLPPSTTIYFGVQARNSADVATAITPIGAAITGSLNSLFSQVGPAGGTIPFPLPNGGTFYVTIPPGNITSSTTFTITITSCPFTSNASYVPALNECPDITANGLGGLIFTYIFVEFGESSALHSQSLSPRSNGDDRVIAVYDATEGVWVPLQTTLDSQGDLSAKTNRLGTFQVMSVTTPGNVDSARIFPNPFRPALGHTSVTFDNLPPEATLKIYTILGEKVRTLTSDLSGMASWDGKNENGNGVASGVYFVFVSKSGGGTKIYKVAVQR